ncbi:MAG: hypothetical protein K2W97_02170 [Chthoniobacterales bacterium]|nr:hypothetical protein [Chthoniobacterales bacterium]
MTVAKPISLVKPTSSLGQQPELSRLSKRELEEVHAAPTHYPQQDHHATDSQSRLDRTSEHSSQKSAIQKSSNTPLSDSLDNTKKSEGQQFKNLVTGHEKAEPIEDNNSDVDESNDGLRYSLDHLPSASSLAGGVTAFLSHVKSLFQPYRPSASLDDDGSIVPTTVVTGNVSKVDLNASQVKEALLQQQAGGQGEVLKIENSSSDSSVLIDGVALMTEGGAKVSDDLEYDESEDQINLADIPVPTGATKKEDEGTLLSRLGIGVESVLPSVNKQTRTDLAAPTLVTSQTSINGPKNTAAFSPSLKESLLDDDGVTSALDLEEQLDNVSSHDQKEESGSVRNMEVRGKIFATQDVGDDTDFNGTQHERAHEATHKMVEGEENNAMIARPAITHAEIAPVTGSAGSSGADLSESVAAALRVTHLLDELTAAVSRLRLDSSDGKEMTIQLRRDVLAETNIHIVSTAKQMEVSFLTSNVASDRLLNTHLTTLQNHLNALCPGQVVIVQTQLTPSSGSSQMGAEQDHSQNDLASFEQGNRGNSNNDNDTL